MPDSDFGSSALDCSHAKTKIAAAKSGIPRRGTERCYHGRDGVFSLSNVSWLVVRCVMNLFNDLLTKCRISLRFLIWSFGCLAKFNKQRTTSQLTFDN